MGINNFNVAIYGNLVPFEKNPLLSLARVRIFYKGLNRNRTLITDEFADKLLQSLPYTPVSGIWSDDDEDYTDHGESREEGRIYGLVPEEPNVAWETHLDEDGIERVYACCDVVLFTARYKNASDIVGKPQSMELYQQSIKGEWVIYEGKKCYKFTDGVFIGLQVLGEETEPCFEGAAFYSYANSLKEMISILKNYNLGGKEMIFNFKLSDREKFDAIWTLLNPNFNEEGDWTVDFCITDIYDEYALVYRYEDAKNYRCYYTKEDDIVALGDMVEVHIVDVTEEEYGILMGIKALNNDSFVGMDTKIQSLMDNEATLNQKLSENEQTIGDLNTKVEELQEAVNNGADTISGLNSKIEELDGALSTEKANAETLGNTITELEAFKKAVEDENKKAEIAKYSMLDAETRKAFEDNLDNYTLQELTNELKIAYVNANANTIFTQNTNVPENHLVPNTAGQSEVLTGAAKLVADYKKRNGGK
jgi:hypothetical protein